MIAPMSPAKSSEPNSQVNARISGFRYTERKLASALLAAAIVISISASECAADRNPLQCRRREIHAFLEHATKEPLEPFGIAGHHLGEAVDVRAPP